MVTTHRNKIIQSVRNPEAPPTESALVKLTFIAGRSPTLGDVTGANPEIDLVVGRNPEIDDITGKC